MAMFSSIYFYYVLFYWYMYRILILRIYENFNVKYSSLCSCSVENISLLLNTLNLHNVSLLMKKKINNNHSFKPSYCSCINIVKCMTSCIVKKLKIALEARVSPLIVHSSAPCHVPSFQVSWV